MGEAVSPAPSSGCSSIQRSAAAIDSKGPATRTGLSQEPTSRSPLAGLRLRRTTFHFLISAKAHHWDEEFGTFAGLCA
jgi:hypothetical protein